MAWTKEQFTLGFLKKNRTYFLALSCMVTLQNGRADHEDIAVTFCSWKRIWHYAESLVGSA